MPRSDPPQQFTVGFESCTIYDNAAKMHGGVISVENRDSESSVYFNLCTIYGNRVGSSTSTDAARGGVIYVNRDDNHPYIMTVTFSSCDVFNNQIENAPE